MLDAEVIWLLSSQALGAAVLIAVMWKATKVRHHTLTQLAGGRIRHKPPTVSRAQFSEIRIWDLGIPMFHPLVLLGWLKVGSDGHWEGTQRPESGSCGHFVRVISCDSVKVLWLQACLETPVLVEDRFVEGKGARETEIYVVYEVAVACFRKASVCWWEGR